MSAWARRWKVVPSISWFACTTTPLWITVMREGLHDPLYEDLGRGYVGGDGLFALTPKGRIKWHFKTGKRVRSSPALYPDGTVVDSPFAIVMNTNPYTYLGTRAFDIAPDAFRRFFP